MAEASREITLKVGASFIQITGSAINIVSPSININGGGVAGIGTPANALLPLATLPPLGWEMFNENVQIIRKETGIPMAFTDYKVIFSDNSVITGKTNEKGNIFLDTKKKELTFEIYIGEE